MGSGLIERASAAVEALFDAPENHGAASNEQIAEAVLAVVVDQEAERLREWLTFIGESTEDDNLCAAVELALKGERVELSPAEWLDGEATVMGLIEHPESLSSRIAGLSESLECGDGGVRGDFRAALAEVDALAEQLQGAVTTLDAADSVARMLAEALRAARTDDEQTREALTMFDLYNAKRGR